MIKEQICGKAQYKPTTKRPDTGNISPFIQFQNILIDSTRSVRMLKMSFFNETKWFHKFACLYNGN